jgi:cell division protein FtsI/penicillin-binding protein 2
VTASGWSSTPPAPAARPASPGRTSAARPGRRRSSRTRGAAAGRSSKDLRDNAVGSFSAPRDKPRIAGVVFLEHGIHGGNAARVAHHILDTFFAKEDGRPLPPPPTREGLHLDLSDPMAHHAAPAEGN